MEIGRFLVADSIHKNSYSDDAGSFNVTLEDLVLYTPGQSVPLISLGKVAHCAGLAKIKKIVISEYGTKVYFDVIDVDEKMAKALYRLYVITTGGIMDANASRVDADTSRTGMSAATRLMMGENRTPRQIAKGQKRRDDDDEEDSIWGMMKRSNPGDSFFDD